MNRAHHHLETDHGSKIEQDQNARVPFDIGSSQPIVEGLFQLIAVVSTHDF